MHTNCNNGIIFSENDPVSRKSCVVFNNIYCLAPASVLINTFHEITNKFRLNRKNVDLYKDLKSSRLIDTCSDQRYNYLQNNHFKIIYAETDGTLYESQAVIVNIFKCRNIWNSFNDILRGFSVKSQSQNTDNDLHKLLLSSFVILRIKAARLNDDEHIRVDPLDVFNEIFQCLGNNPRAMQMNENVFQTNEVTKLECIESISTPFGNECFLNTINVGKIANIFGHNKCLIVASMPLVNGCEGGSVYNRIHQLIGIVISTTFDWNNENATLTLVAKFNEILAEFLHQAQVNNIDVIDVSSICPNKQMKMYRSALMENYIVLIQSSSGWGSGCLIKIGDTRLIITCAHVLENHDDSVTCTWKFGRFNSHVIFANPFFDEAFDIAILDVPNDIPDEHFTRCYTAQTDIGDVVYSSGFPHFTSLGKVNHFLPSIFEGRITKISKGVIFSDASVQSGQSGGPLFTVDGYLLGVCISNSKDDKYQLIYPNINMSVPIFDILPILQKYVRSKGNKLDFLLMQTKPLILIILSNFFSFSYR